MPEAQKLHCVRCQPVENEVVGMLPQIDCAHPFHRQVMSHAAKLRRFLRPRYGSFERGITRRRHILAGEAGQVIPTLCHIQQRLRAINQANPGGVRC